MNKIFIGIDNGVTGSIAAIYPTGEYLFEPTPTKTEQSYTKTAQNITRIHSGKLMDLVSTWLAEDEQSEVKVILERPFVNPKGFKATVSAMRALEATIVILEYFNLSFQYIDSKEWQKVMLPAGIAGTPELKKASLDIGTRLFPKIVTKHKDRDSILIAEYARRNNF